VCRPGWLRCLHVPTFPEQHASLRLTEEGEKRKSAEACAGGHFVLDLAFLSIELDGVELFWNLTVDYLCWEIISY